MIASDLAELIAKITKMPVGTVHGRLRVLRASGAVTVGGRGRFGVAEMSTADAVALLLACLADHPHGSDPADNVRHVRSIPCRDSTLIVDNFADALAFTRAASFGEALDAVIDDMRSGAWVRFENSVPIAAHLSVTIDFENLDAGIMLTRQLSEYGSGHWFFRASPPHGQGIWRQTMIRDEALKELAAALGPPT